MAEGSAPVSDVNTPNTGLTSFGQGSSPAQPEERTFKQSEVNDIVKRAKYGAVEDFKRLQSEQPQYAREKYLEDRPSQVQPQVSEENIRKMASEEAERLRDQWVQDARSKAEQESAQRIVQDFVKKISPGKEKYQDFEKVTGDIEYGRFGMVVQLLAQYVDNSHDVLYELGKDRFKLVQLEQLAHMSPKDAIVQVQRLAKSIKDNEGTSNIKMPNEPLDQMQPSTHGTDNKVLSVTDYKKKYRM